MQHMELTGKEFCECEFPIIRTGYCAKCGKDEFVFPDDLPKEPLKK